MKWEKAVSCGHRKLKLSCSHTLQHVLRKQKKGVTGKCFLKLYYDENRIFPIETFWKHKQVVCTRRKMAFTIFLNIPFLSRDIQVFEICKLAKWWRREPLGINAIDAMNKISYCLTYHSFLFYISKLLYVTVILYSFSFSPRRRFVFQTEISGKYIVFVLFHCCFISFLLFAVRISLPFFA